MSTDTYPDADDAKERLYDEYGKPPERDEPLDLEAGQLVYVCAMGALFTIEKGEVMETGLTYEYVDRKVPDEGFTHEENATYVKVRFGPSMHESTYVPEKYVLEILKE